jgi:hypothetical protein
MHSIALFCRYSPKYDVSALAHYVVAVPIHSLILALYADPSRTIQQIFELNVAKLTTRLLAAFLGKMETSTSTSRSHQIFFQEIGSGLDLDNGKLIYPEAGLPPNHHSHAQEFSHLLSGSHFDYYSCLGIPNRLYCCYLCSQGRQCYISFARSRSSRGNCPFANTDPRPESCYRCKLLK